MQNGEDTASPKSPAPSQESFERKIILLLCILAAARVFIFSAAFPFFNNVDETAHFDLIIKYSHGNVPRGMDTISADSAGYIALMNSRVYYGIPGKFPGGQMPLPLWMELAPQMQADLARSSASWQKLENYEISQNPLYFIVAGIWWHVGKCLGFHNGGLLYWLRFLNILIVTAIVWLGYLAARIVFPKNVFPKLAMPALLAFLPQTAFYSLGNDTISALCFGLTFICLLKWLSSEIPTVSLGITTGLAFAAAYLAKVTNFPLLILTLAVLSLKAFQNMREGKWQAVAPAFIAFFGCAAPLIGCWMFWSKLHFGDLTGSRLNTQFFALTIKPVAEWWHHPIFSPYGVWTYLSGQMTTFWQGQFMWHYQFLMLPGTDIFYTALSLGLFAAALTGLPSRSQADTFQRHALWLSMVCFLILLIFFAMLSVIYDFSGCPDPTPAHPYFREGRLMLGALVPFMLLMAYGLDHVLNRFKTMTKFITLSVIIFIMLAVEISTDWLAFSNPYNWFHLP
jgi:hypothetical protein